MATDKQVNEQVVEDATLVTVAQGISDSSKGIKGFIENVPNLPTDHLATGYAVIKAFEGEFKDLVQTVRDEFIGTQDEDGSYNADGRLFTDPTSEEDEKGNRVLTMPDGVVLKASKSQKNTFLPERAAEMLEEHDLVKEGSNHDFIVKDKDALGELLNFCLNVIPEEHKDEFTELMTATIDNKYTPDEDKILALITTGQLDSSVVDDLFAMKTGYSLLVSKNPYKPKATKKKK